MILQWSDEYINGLNSINFKESKIELKAWTSEYQFAQSNTKITSNINQNKIVYTIQLVNAVELEWKTFD